MLCIRIYRGCKKSRFKTFMLVYRGILCEQTQRDRFDCNIVLIHYNNQKKKEKII